MPPPPDFPHSELKLALSEQLPSQLVQSYTLIPRDASEPHAARARVVLLEGNEVEVRLTLEGYEVVGKRDKFETLEGLLERESPMWKDRNLGLLAEALGRIKKEREEAKMGAVHES